MSVDVDGVSFGGSGERAMRVEYKLRLQPEKTKKQKCRYSSQWQGLVGSGYNELIVRESDTVWDEVKNLRREVTQYVENVF